MILKRFYDEKLAQASYLVGCAATGEALVVDPLRDVREYLEVAETEKLRITHVTETHIHADYASGLGELVARTGARAYLSGEGGPNWRYEFAAELDAVLLRDGDEFRVGNVRVQALHTPGHTPEHLTYVVTDTAGADQPMGALTGDFVFVGDVGRPDLLERAAGVADTMEVGARQLHHSLRRFAELPDWLQLWPGHGAGSACGKALGAVPSSTLGYEKLFNWAFSVHDEDEFVRLVLEGQPDPPRYFAVMKRLNRAGPPLLGGLPEPPRLEAELLPGLAAAGAVIVDTRPWSEYRFGYLPGTLNIPLERSFTNWAGWLLPYDRDIHLIVDERGTTLAEAVRDLVLIGLDRVAGWFDASALRAAERAGHELQRVPEIDAEEAHARLEAGDVAILDVRAQSEWDAGRIADAPLIPLGHLPGRIDDVPAGRPLVLYCRSGRRSGIAASVLAAHGITDVINLAGGYQAWSRAGLTAGVGK